MLTNTQACHHPLLLAARPITRLIQQLKVFLMLKLAPLFKLALLTLPAG